MKLELFKYDTCPYCQRVMREIERQERTDVLLCDIHASDEALQRLLEVGGRQQVPCLFIDGEPLYESADIVSWLQEHPQSA